MPESTIINGTAVSIEGCGVLLVGPSGSGKSDLALRLIDRGAKLISDDRIVITKRDGSLILSAHQEIAGMLEVRGLGIIRLPVSDSPLKLVVDVSCVKPPERLPEVQAEYEVLGYRFCKANINAFEVSAPVRVELALRGGFIQGKA